MKLITSRAKKILARLKYTSLPERDIHHFSKFTNVDEYPGQAHTLPKLPDDNKLFMSIFAKEIWSDRRQLT